MGGLECFNFLRISRIKYSSIEAIPHTHKAHVLARTLTPCVVVLRLLLCFFLFLPICLPCTNNIYSMFTPNFLLFLRGL